MLIVMNHMFFVNSACGQTCGIPHTKPEMMISVGGFNLIQVAMSVPAFVS